MLEERSATAASLMAMGRLAEQMEVRQGQERGRFRRRFEGFADRTMKEQFRCLLGRGRGGSADR